VHPRELAEFCRQFAMMSRADINLLDILKTLEQQTENEWFRRILSSAQRDVEFGRSLASAFSRFPADFSPFFIQMVRQGEAEGVLDEVFFSLAQHLEREAEGSGAFRRLLAGGTEAALARSRPLLVAVATIVSLALMVGGGLWMASLFNLLERKYLGPELLFLGGAAFLSVALAFSRFLPTAVTRCSFCGKPAQEVSELVAGQGVAICDSCVAFSVRQLKEKPRRSAPRVAPPAPEPEKDRVVDM